MEYATRYDSDAANENKFKRNTHTQNNTTATAIVRKSMALNVNFNKSVLFV